MEYEGLHLICFGCGKYGHLAEGCSGTGTAASTVPNEPTSWIGVEEDQSFGPWMMPKQSRQWIFGGKVGGGGLPVAQGADVGQNGDALG